MFNPLLLARRIFGSSNDRYIFSLQPIVKKINALEPQMQALDDTALRHKTEEYRERISKGESLNALLPEAFATVREAAVRTLGQRHYDVQLMGGVVLHRGEVSEMRTGEGKTLVATLAVYLNALAGKGVHVVTVNDYLAKRDSEWMGQIYRFLGLEVGVIFHNLSDEERKAAYRCDITYATNNELGFDYLRDNMKYALDTMVQRPFYFAIVDEVDSILIDEARTPLIISGPSEDKSELYFTINQFVKQLDPEDYEIDEKQRSAILTEAGTERVERMLNDAGVLKDPNLYAFENTQIVHHVNQALRANTLFQKDVDYLVKKDKVIIVDEFTGRMMEGRRWSDGLHQAVEAKEGVTVQPENQTLASITFQNYFRLYEKLAGMTGTATTEAQELYDIYKLNVVEVPTNLPVTREDSDDQFFRTAEEKYTAIVETIREASDNGQPVLVGTASIEKSELLSNYLKKAKIHHTVLNARFHEQEAHIVAQAGRAGAVTIATNMAGRGTDIQLGGNPDFRLMDENKDITNPDKIERAQEKIAEEIAEEKQRVLDAGGLFVLGTERHESRRIDNQLRGRSGRQGDPGYSQFYLSLEDDLLRIFGPQDRMNSLMLRLGIEEGEAIVHPWLNKAIEKAQQKVEARNYDIRKQLLQYDDVMNDQRKVVYEQRCDIMASDTVSDIISDMRVETAALLIQTACPQGSYPENWKLDELIEEAESTFSVKLDFKAFAERGDDPEAMEASLLEAATRFIESKKVNIPLETWNEVEKAILLQCIDQRWKEHLATLDALRQVVHLRAYAQRNPLNEYKAEAFALFSLMLEGVRQDVCQLLAQADFSQNQDTQDYQEFGDSDQFVPTHIDPFTGENDALQSRGPLIEPEDAAQAIKNKDNYAPSFDPYDLENWRRTIPRNAPCPCGSKKKFKFCHGVLR